MDKDTLHLLITSATAVLIVLIPLYLNYRRDDQRQRFERCRRRLLIAYRDLVYFRELELEHADRGGGGREAREAVQARLQYTPSEASQPSNLKRAIERLSETEDEAG